jgi:glycosyltransferase 2 family protein
MIFLNQNSPDTPVASGKRHLFLMLKIAVTTGLLYWLLSSISLNEMRSVMAPIQVHHIVIGLVLQSIALILGCLRWWILLRHVSGPIPLGKVIPSFYLGIFFNHIMPTTVGGDAIRILHMRRYTSNTKALISSTIMDRITGVMGVLIMGTTAVIAFPVVSSNPGLKTILLISLIFLVGILPLLASAPFTKLVSRLTIRFQHAKKRRWLLELTSLCQSYAGAKKRLVAAFLLTLVLQALTVLIYYMLGSAIGIQLSLPAYFACISLVFLAGALPVSLGGLGIREGVLVGLLITLGVDTRLAISLSLLYLFVYLSVSLPGGLVILFSGTTGKNHNERKKNQNT